MKYDEIIDLFYIAKFSCVMDSFSDNYFRIEFASRVFITTIILIHKNTLSSKEKIFTLSFIPT